MALAGAAGEGTPMNPFQNTKSTFVNDLRKAKGGRATWANYYSQKSCRMELGCKFNLYFVPSLLSNTTAPCRQLEVPAKVTTAAIYEREEIHRLKTCNLSCHLLKTGQFDRA